MKIAAIRDALRDFEQEMVSLSFVLKDLSPRVKSAPNQGEDDNDLFDEVMEVSINEVDKNLRLLNNSLKTLRAIEENLAAN